MGGLVIVLSDNPLVKYLIPENLEVDGIYSTTTLEIKENIFTGKIVGIFSKTKLLRNVLKDYNGGINKINFHTDGGESDNKVIRYLKGFYGNNKLTVYKYNSRVC